MARTPDTVEVPLATLEALQARIASLEQQQRIQGETLAASRTKILDPDYEAWKQEVARPAHERTQAVADKTFGTQAPRFRCRLDSTAEDGKAGPKIGEHFELIVSANSDLEAGARYLRLMGIKKHDYRLIAAPVAA